MFYIDGEHIKDVPYSFNVGSYDGRIVKNITDCWVTMLAVPTPKFENDGTISYSYSYSHFSGSLYSARMYDYALDEEDVKGLVNDEIKYYGNEADAPIAKAFTKTYTSDGDGIIHLNCNDFNGYNSNEFNTKNIKVSVDNKVSYLSNDPSGAKYPLTIYEPSKDNPLSLGAIKTNRAYKDTALNLVVNGNDVKWYRSTSNSYKGKDISDAAIIDGNKSILYIQAGGYYYATVNGQVTDIVYLKNPQLLLPPTDYRWNRDPIPGCYGRKYDGTYVPYTNSFVNGGVAIRNFIHETTNGVMNLFNLDKYEVSENMPNLLAYSNGVDTLTLELDDTHDKSIKVTVKDSKENELLTSTMTSRNLSFTYDYQSALIVEWTDGENYSSKYIKPQDVRNTISTYGSHYYYLTDHAIETDSNSIDETAANIYRNEALLRDGSIINLDNNVRSEAKEMFKVTNNKPLYAFDVDGVHVETYYSYSITSDNENVVLVDGEVVVKNGEAYTLSPSFSQRPTAMIVDTYREREFLTIMNEDEMVDLIDEIRTPEDFTKYDIAEISSTILSDSHIALVRYLNGNIVGFDYLTGEPLKLISSNNQNFFEFIGSSLSGMLKMHKANGLQGSYGFAAGQIDVLGNSYDDQVLDLFTAKANPEDDEAVAGDGLGHSKTLELITDKVHGENVLIKYNDKEKRFVIEEAKDSTVVQYKNSIGDATSSKANNTNKSDKNKLQDKIDELAEKDVIPNLSKGIVKKTQTVDRSNNVINFAFSLAIVGVLASLLYVVLRRYRGI